MIWAVILAFFLPDSLDMTIPEDFQPTFLQTVRIVHTPPEILFKGRRQELTCFVEFPRDSVKSVTLFIKSNTMSSYREIALRGNSNLYSFQFYDTDFPGDTLTYFFTVELTDKIFAVPLNAEGKIQPVIRPYVDAREYYHLKP